MRNEELKILLQQHDKKHRSIKKMFTAGEDILTQSAVYLDSNGTIKKFDSTNLLLNRKCLGITSSTAYTGNQICVVLFGEIKITSQILVESSVYFAVENGDIDVSFPIPGLTVKVGTALSECLLFIDIDHEEPAGVDFNIYVQDYTIVGAFDGINIDFQTTAPFTPGTLALYLNGVRMYLNDDYIITGPDTFQMTFVPNTTGKFLAEYIPL